MRPHIIFYWTNFAREWKQRQLFHAPRKLFKTARRGDVVWALARRGTGDYVFVARFVVARANPEREHPYGKYSITCNEDSSRLFDSAGQRWTEAELRRRFGFEQSRKPLGHWFHGANSVRQLPLRTASFLEREYRTWPTLGVSTASAFGSFERQRPSGIPKVEYEKILATIARRRGQDKFREALLDTFGRRCAITGCRVEAALEGERRSPRGSWVASE